MITAVPSVTEVTIPDDETVATALSDDVHVTVASLIVAPFWSLTVAVSCCVDPSDVNERLVGDSVIDAGICTVTEAVALVEPDIAVIVAIPFATAVTRPVEDTVATDALDELHDTLAPCIVAPFWSLTVAESWDV